MSSIVINRLPVNKKLNHPPGPKGHWLFGTTREFNENPLGAIARYHQEYGPALRFRFFWNFYGYSFIHPDQNKHILVDNNKNYTKDPHPTNLILKPALGNSLLTSDGDFWRQQRRLAQPAFHRQRIANFGETMTESTLDMLDRWHHFSTQNPGRLLDVAEEMMRLTLEIVGRTLFGVDLTGAAADVGDAFTRINEYLSSLTAQAFGVYTIRLPFLAGNRQLRQDVAVLDNLVQEIINARRQTDAESEDLLGLLLAARDEETGIGMSDKQLRDEVVTILLAGHETTAIAMSWIFYLLARHPHVMTRLQAEVDEVLGDERATMADLPHLSYTRMVIEESMRLYPPAYGMARFGNEVDEVAGYYVAPQATITLLPYLTHRLPEFWPEPEKFDPLRFTPENAADRHRYAYIPFGGGPRLCIGNTFALTEATLLLATITQHYELSLPPGYQAELEPLITLRPKGGMPMYLQHRQDKAQPAGMRHLT
jgi:cytochrome P450